MHPWGQSESCLRWLLGVVLEPEGKFIPIHMLAKGRGSLIDFQQGTATKRDEVCVWVSLKLQLRGFFL